ncbi:hypothetical protein [Streptomyces botrytidirepellens]|uniref:Uncharacterized protein n=1 Tax=Streptomyces botrytidirepellens TaxID=2486417 RepID=A0A3M8VYG0_9ACTN|nr:hypothetical protein [Streptomyces botrytidirepellens]RNG21235.1 hypothetical protein EEJ42_22650 [Streptomyces botrytidirepellens]
MLDLQAPTLPPEQGERLDRDAYKRGSGSRQVAIAVVVEGKAGSGGREGGAATPIAKRAMEAAIARR